MARWADWVAKEGRAMLPDAPLFRLPAGEGLSAEAYPQRLALLDLQAALKAGGSPYSKLHAHWARATALAFNTVTLGYPEPLAHAMGGWAVSQGSGTARKFYRGRDWHTLTQLAKAGLTGKHGRCCVKLKLF